jgi:hypothetical protein
MSFLSLPRSGGSAVVASPSLRFLSAAAAVVDKALFLLRLLERGASRKKRAQMSVGKERKSERVNRKEKVRN